MTTMQTHVGARSALAADGGFDIWHDYMDLGGLLLRLCDGREGDHVGATEGPKRETPGPWGHFQTSVREDCSRDSLETSSVSSGGGGGSSSSSGGTCSSSSSSSSSELCRFCLQNGESARVYRSHRLKSDDGRVVCPILWNYTCPICEATGDNAHTRRYCPQLRRRQETASKRCR